MYVTSSSGFYTLNILQNFELEEISFLAYQSASELIIYDNYAIFTSGYNGVNIIDISNPNSPIQVGNYVSSGKYIQSISRKKQ
jgi:hypothetical protein